MASIGLYLKGQYLALMLKKYQKKKYKIEEISFFILNLEVIFIILSHLKGIFYLNLYIFNLNPYLTPQNKKIIV